MKKLSKVTMQMGETLGIDLGDKVSRYCIVDPLAMWSRKGAFATRPVPWKTISATGRGGSRSRPARSRPGSAASGSGWGTTSSWPTRAS